MSVRFSSSWLKHPLTLVGAVLLCSGVAFWAGMQQVRELSSEAYAEQRMPLINSTLSEVSEGFVLLVGDSHAELMNPTYRLCGREVVNGGVSGAKAELYRDLAGLLAFKAKPEMVVLSMGTNNLLRKKDPLSAGPADEFEKNVVRTVASFRKVARRVVVLAVPPISPEMKGKFEIGAVRAYSERLRNLCARGGCEFVDPYDATREADGSTARPNATADGVHLKSYRAVHDGLEKLVCPNRGA